MTARKDPLANAYRQWVVEHVGGGHYVLKSVHLLGNLDSCEYPDAARVDPNPDAENSRQRWQIEPLDVPGQVSIRSVHLGG